LDRQIALIRPKLIVALGKTAAVRVTGQDVAMGALRGKVWEYQSVPVVVTYHPAYLLRNLPEKAKAWEDMLFAKKVMAQLVG
jgi:uracil-DNA glycosylase